MKCGENKIMENSLIRGSICDVLLRAHNNPKRKWKKVTFPVLYREVKNRIGSSRQIVLSNLNYLVDAKIIKLEKEKWTSVGIGRSKPSKGTTKYYSLKSSTIDKLERGQTWRPNKRKYSQNISIVNSNFNAPFAIGNDNNIVSYDINSDIAKIIELIKEKTDLIQQKEVIELIKTNLSLTLEAPDIKQTQIIIKKLQKLGQTWLIPIISQLVSTYFQHKLGINS